MSTTTRMGHGLAVSPEKDLAMFAEIARKGKHLSGVNGLAHGFTFTDGPAEDLVFDLAHEDHPDADYFDIFHAAGWTHVVSVGNAHIFRAPAGTTPVHSSAESRLDELVHNRNQYALYSAIAVAALVAIGFVLRQIEWNRGPRSVIITLAIIPVAYTVVPLIGYMRELHRTRA